MFNQQCTLCVMDTSDPEIIFDSEGVCNHCKSAKIQLSALGDTSEKQARLDKTISDIKARNANKQYDVIMGVSGGVDSSYAIVKAKEMGLRILAVHCDTGWNSSIAVNNINILIEKLDIDLETIVVDWPAMKGLQRSFFMASVSNCDIPQDHAIVAVNNQVASTFGINDFISGGNLAGEAIMPGSWGYDARDLKHLKAINKKFDNVNLKLYPKLSAFMSYFYMPFVKGIRNYRMLNDMDYNPTEAKKVLMEQYGWKDYGGKHHESVFTRFYQAYYLPNKFGFDKRKGHLSSLIAAGQLSRKEAVSELKKPLYNLDQLRNDQAYFIKKLSFTEDEWEEIMNSPVVSHYKYPTNRKAHALLTKLKNIIELNGIKIRRSW